MCLLTHRPSMESILLKIEKICNSQFKCNYLKNKRVFLNFFFFFRFLESKSNFKHFEKNMMLIANDFPKLQTVKNFDRPRCKKRRFGARIDSQHVKLSQLLVKSPSEHFHHVFSSLWGTVIWKMSPLVWGKTLSVFLNI